MKITTLLPSLLILASYSVSAAGNPFSSSRGQPSIYDSKPDLSVPGDNPLFFCAKPDNHTLTITHVDLSPNPPMAGQKLTITANGTLHHDITDGAKVHLTVKYGLIRLISTTEDLCTQVKQVDLECPIRKGALGLSKDVELPREIPVGKYTVTADVYSQDQETITCLMATVVFGVHKSLAGRIHLEM